MLKSSKSQMGDRVILAVCVFASFVRFMEGTFVLPIAATEKRSLENVRVTLLAYVTTTT